MSSSARSGASVAESWRASYGAVSASAVSWGGTARSRQIHCEAGGGGAWLGATWQSTAYHLATRCILHFSEMKNADRILKVHIEVVGTHFSANQTSFWNKFYKKAICLSNICSNLHI